MPEITLTGCRPEPLGSYLKGLAVLRLVSQQADAEARGWWEQDQFRIASRLDTKGLLDFLLQEYRPTPIMAPWNGGSGFHPKDNQDGVNALSASDSPRIRAYRDSIEIVKHVLLLHAKGGDLDERRRTQILLECRNRLPDEAMDWLDAAIAVTADGSRAFPPLLGTGGNDGRLEYTNTFMKNIADLLVRPNDPREFEPLLKNALFGTRTNGLISGSVGQYDPGRAGGFNQGQGVEEEKIPSNPWNSVLTMEGTLMWASGLYRRQNVRSKSFLCSPFTVRPSVIGYSSATESDRKESARAEVWAPLWSRASTFREVQALFREGRASVGTRGVEDGVGFAQAACSLGVQRGITSFVRYQLLQRRGRSYLALPTGRIGVAATPREGVDLVEELHPVLDQVDRFIRISFREGPPASLGKARTAVDEKIFQFLLRGAQDHQFHFRQLAAAVGRLEMALALRTGGSIHVSPKLSQGWITECGDQLEVRVAAALTSLGAPPNGIRGNLLANAEDGRFAWRGRDLAAKLCSVLRRRVLDRDRPGVQPGTDESGAESSKRGTSDPFYSSTLLRAEDSAAFLEGGLDESLLEDLIFAFTLVNRRDEIKCFAEPIRDVPIPASYALIKHLFLSTNELKRSQLPELRGDAAMISLIAAGRIEEAAQLCRNRLRANDLPVIHSAFPDDATGERLAASLLIPTRFSRWWSAKAIDWQELTEQRSEKE